MYAPEKNSTAWKACAFFAANPTLLLTAKECGARFDCPNSAIPALLHTAISQRVIERSKNPDGSWRYHAGANIANVRLGRPGDPAPSPPPPVMRASSEPLPPALMEQLSKRGQAEAAAAPAPAPVTEAPAPRPTPAPRQQRAHVGATELAGIVIESGVPCPPANNRSNYAGVLEQIGVGYSVRLESEAGRRFYLAALNYGKRVGRKFVSRKDGAGYIRIWRTE